MPVWVPFVTAILGAVIGAIVTYVLGGRRERATSKRGAVFKFRAAFAPVITQIDNKDPHFLMNKAQEQHDVAIYEFRPFVDSNEMKNFDEAVENFRRCRSALIPATLAVWESLGSGKPLDKSNAIALKDALNRLLAFADKT